MIFLKKNLINYYYFFVFDLIYNLLGLTFSFSGCIVNVLQGAVGKGIELL